MGKQKIRKDTLNQLKSLEEERRIQYNEDLLHQLMQTTEWHEAECIAITLSRPPELDTQLVIEAAWQIGKQVVIPYSGKNRLLSFFIYEPTTELELSSYGLLEPKNRLNPINKSDIDLIIVPGLAYASEGYRVGFGGGFYDRYLADYGGRTISLLYPFQLNRIVEDVVAPFDIAVEKLLIAAE